MEYISMKFDRELETTLYTNSKFLDENISTAFNVAPCYFAFARFSRDKSKSTSQICFFEIKRLSCHNDSRSLNHACENVCDRVKQRRKNAHHQVHHDSTAVY